MPLGARLSTVVLAATLLLCVAAPLLSPHEPNRTHLLHTYAPPWPLEESDPRFLLGTDALGRDLLSRLVHGLRLSIGIAFAGMLLGAAFGALVGLVSGFAGGAVDRLLMGLVDVQITIPFLLVVLIGIVILGSSVETMILLVGFAGWETYARVLRGQVLALKAEPFVSAVEAIGARPHRIVLVHLVPHLAAPLIVLMTLNFPAILLLESSLSFLGIGVQPPTATLGRMIGEGRNDMLTAWWLVAGPAAVMLVVTLAVQTLGDFIRDRAERGSSGDFGG
jgi:peptide/nickel transport system permease protein